MSKSKSTKQDKPSKVLQSPGVQISDMKMWDEQREEFVQVNSLQAPLDIPEFLRRDKR